MIRLDNNEYKSMFDNWFIIMVLVLVIGFLSAIAFGCGSAHKVQKIDTVIEPKGIVGDRVIGINSDNELILQQERTAEEELKGQEADNARLADIYVQERHELDRCRLDVSDVRLGGTGVIPSIMEVDNLKALEVVREEIGLTEDGQVKVVKKSYYTDKLRLERSYEKTIQKMIAVTSRHRAECEYKMGQMRRAVGLPSTRYTGTGYFPNDGSVWIQTRQDERNLDDAFAIQATQQAQKK